MPDAALPLSAPDRARRTVQLVAASSLLWGLQFAFLSPSIGLLLSELYGASAGEVGWALAAYNLSGFVSTLVVPARADRRGDYLKPLLMCGVLTVALVTALALATTLPLAVLALVTLGGPAGVAVGLLFAYQRATGSSAAEIMRVRAVFSFAWVAGPPAATLLLGLLGRRSVLWVVAALAALGMGVTVALRRVAGSTGSSGDPVGVVTSDPPTMRSLLRDRRLLVLVVAFVLLAAANNASVSVTALFVVDRLGLDLLWGGVALGVAAALEVPALLVMARFAHRVRSSRLVALGALSSLAYYLVMVVVSGPTGLVGAQVLNALGVAATVGVGVAVFQEAIDRPGLASGVFLNTTRIGAFVAGPVVGTGGLTAFGYALVFAVCAGLALVGGLFLLVVGRDARPTG